MPLKTIIFGDVGEELCEFGKSFQTRLVDQSNLEIAYNDLLNYHTSVGDISIEQAIKLAERSQRIILQPKTIAEWTDIKLLKTTLYLCRFLNHRIKVENLENYSIPELVYQDPIPDSHHPALYLFGGSTVFGGNLNNRDSRFGQILGQRRNLIIIDHSKVGGGLRRSFEQLISCNPKQDDVVILDTTIPTRVRLSENLRIKDQQLHQCPREIVLSLNDEQIFYNHISYFDAFVKHAKSLKVKFVFYSNQIYEDLHFDYLLHYSKHREWCLKTSRIIDTPVDFCSDKVHIGPKSHLIVANLLDKKISELYE